MAQQRIYFNSRDKLIRLYIQKIVYFEGDGNYTYIVTTNKQKVCQRFLIQTKQIKIIENG